MLTRLNLRPSGRLEDPGLVLCVRSRKPLPLQGLVGPRPPCRSSRSLGSALPIAAPVPISDAHETGKQVLLGRRPHLKRPIQLRCARTGPRPQLLMLYHITPTLCPYPRRVFCVWLNRPLHSPLQTEVGTWGFNAHKYCKVTITQCSESCRNLRLMISFCPYRSDLKTRPHYTKVTPSLDTPGQTITL